MRQLNIKPNTSLVQIDFTAPITLFDGWWPFQSEEVVLKTEYVWVKPTTIGHIIDKNSPNDELSMNPGDALGVLTDGTPFVMTPRFVGGSYAQLTEGTLRIVEDRR